MNLFKDYRQKNLLPPGLASLYTAKTITMIATGFIGLFLPIFLLQQFNSLSITIGYYLVTWVIYLLVAALGARLINIFGLKKVIMMAMPFLALFYVCLYLIDYNLWLFTVLAIFFLTIYRMFYWVPYHTELAKLSRKKNRGKQLSLLDSLSSFLGVVIPAVSGLLIKSFGFKIVFIIVIILILISIIPLNFLPNFREKFSWTYRQTWREFFKKANRRMMITYMADGAENWIGAVLWPIFIWQILQGEYVQVGVITSIITLVAVVIKLIIGDFTDRYDKVSMMRTGSILYSIGWIIKIFITTGFQIFIASTYHSFALILLRTPYSTLVYEKSADSGHYVDEYSTLREMYHQAGRIILIILVLILLNFLSLNLIFIFAAVASLLFNLMPGQGFVAKLSSE